MNKSTCWLCYFVLILAGAMLIWFMVEAFYPFKVGQVNTQPQTTRLGYRHGDTIFYTLDYCFYGDTTLSLSKAFVDGIVYYLPKEYITPKRGCYVDTFSSVKIPENLPTGEYYLLIQSQTDINLFQTRTYEWKTNVFKIIE